MKKYGVEIISTKPVCETTDYAKFETLYFNRKVKKVKNLRQSLLKHGNLWGFPIVCILVNGKLIIISGHHRFNVCKSLGMPIKFIVEDNIPMETVEELLLDTETGTNPWDLRDYLDAFMRAGKLPYHLLNTYQQETGIALGTCINIWMGGGAKTKKPRNDFKLGIFEMNEKKMAGLMKDVICHCQNLNIECATNQMFVGAIYNILHIESLDLKRLKQRIQARKHTFEKKGSREQYLEMIEKAYNFGKIEGRLGLKFMAGQVKMAA